jgi:hypothetical protein
MVVKHGKGPFTKEASQGEVRTGIEWQNGKLTHPTNMDKYEGWANDPETRIGIDLLADMIVGTEPYVEMPPKDDDGKEINPEHPNKATCEKWLRGKLKRFKEIERTKFIKGFCPVELVSEDNSFKILPPESFFIHRDKKGKFIKYTQEDSGSEVAAWTDEKQIVLFIHDEDSGHPYGLSLLDSIGVLLDGRRQINIDMPKIIHRYSRPLGIWITDRDISTVYNAVTSADVNEDIFIGNASPESLSHEYIEANAQVKFLPYIDQINYQIAENMHAPLILLLKSANKASADTMLDSVNLFVEGEQSYDALIYQDEFFKPLCGDGPVPLLKWGAPKKIFDEISLGDIAQLYNAKGLNGQPLLTWEQAQDLIRQKGIPLIEVAEPQIPQAQPMIPGVSGKGPGQPFQFEPPKDMPPIDNTKVSQLQASLGILKDAFHHKQITLTEAVREGDRVIRVCLAKAKSEAIAQVSKTLGKPMVDLGPEATHTFELLRCEFFDQYKESLMPTGIRGAVKTATERYTIIPHSS